MMHRNLETHHLPGVHDNSHLASALCGSSSEWCIDLNHVSAFTTDNGSNIVKTVKEDLEVTHLPCAGHTLNLAVQSALKVSAISTALNCCKKSYYTNRPRKFMLKAAADGATWTCIDTG